MSQNNASAISQSSQCKTNCICEGIAEICTASCKLIKNPKIMSTFDELEEIESVDSFEIGADKTDSIFEWFKQKGI